MQILTLALTLSLAQQPPVPMVNPPSLEVTVARVQQVETNIAEIRKLQELLQKISNQAIALQGEDQNVDEYVNNAVLILKTRAVLLVKMRTLCAAALDAKYALEATLDDYNQWLEAAQAVSKQRDVTREDKVKELNKKADIAEQEFYIAASSLKRILAQRKEALTQTDGVTPKDEKDAAEVAKINDRLARLTSYFDALQRSNFRPRPNADLQRVYDNMESSQYMMLEKKLDELDQAYSDAKYEADFIEKNVLGSNSNLINKLGSARKAQLEKARKLLEDSRKLETIASEVSIASRHVRQMLVEIDQPIDIANKGILIEAKLAIEQDVGKALREITGVERRSIWDRLAPTAPPAPPAPMPMEK